MNPKLTRILQEACSATGTGVQQFLDDYCLDAEMAAKERQKAADIKAAVLSFIDLKADEATMYRLLQKHFKVDSIAEATEYIRAAKYTSQIIRLREYQEKNGMTAGAFRQYAIDYQLEEKLKTNPKLLDMSPEKLKAHIEKN